MSNDIRIRKGLDIRLVGEAVYTTQPLIDASVYGIKPDDFHSIVPKMIVREGDTVQAGSALFCSKKDERILFPSPVSGKVTEVVRAERRRVVEIKIQASETQSYIDFGVKRAKDLSPQQLKDHLLQVGCWPFIKQRPYDVIANPDDTPKEIFISAYNTSPLSPDYDYTLKGKEEFLQEAVDALSKLTTGKVHISVDKDAAIPSVRQLKNVEIHNLLGPHPVGNVSVQIAQVSPINKGEVVWVVTPQDLVVIGELLLTGKLNLTRVVALTGASVSEPRYITLIAGAKISDVISSDIQNFDTTRIISGNVLTGKKVSKDGYLGFYDNHITAIPEGKDYDLFGWARPIFDKISTTRAMTFSWLQPNKKYNLNTNTNGEHRAFVVTGAYEQVFPLDIYPMQLLKACLYKDLDEMESLGAYEVAPEDFALTEFICVSKQPHQKIIREGLDLMIKEL